MTKTVNKDVNFAVIKQPLISERNLNLPPQLVNYKKLDKPLLRNIYHSRGVSKCSGPKLFLNE